MKTALLVAFAFTMFSAIMSAQITGGVNGRAPAVQPQASVRPHPVRNPYSGRRVLGPGFWGGGGFGGQQVIVHTSEAAPAAKEDKLKELIISPVYKADKISPKLIEMP